jgi:hypothetical protein
MVWHLLIQSLFRSASTPKLRLVQTLLFFQDTVADSLTIRLLKQLDFKSTIGDMPHILEMPTQ